MFCEKKRQRKKWKETARPIYTDPDTSVAYYQTVRYNKHAFENFGPYVAYYKMWYDRKSSGGIGFATSPDGIHWSFVSPVSGLVPAARHSRVLFDKKGFGIGFPYRIFYADFAQVPFLNGNATLNMLRTAVSLDGVTWVQDQNLRQDVTRPLLQLAPAYNRGSFGPGDVLYFPKNPARLDLCVAMNNRYVMYYDITDGVTEELSLGVSVDGFLWTKFRSPVVRRGKTGAWDDNFVAEHCSVVKEKNKMSFLMWYSGGSGSSHEGIGCASSPDGVHWTKAHHNPVLSINDDVPWRDTFCYNPWILADDTKKLKMWFTGGTNDSVLSIGYAEKKTALLR